MIFSRTISTILVAALLAHCKPVPHSSNFYARAACKPRVDSQSSSTPSHQPSPSPSPTSSPLPTSSPVPSSSPVSSPSPLPSPSPSSSSSASCFPAVGFTMPSTVPQDLTGWWCDMSTEYAFMGFSYAVNSCQSAAQLKKEFADIRKTFNGRYVRIYAACDNDGFYDDVIDAAWESGIGVQALVWFGFNRDNQWQTRWNQLLTALLNNPKAPYVIRAVQFGSESLYDQVTTDQELAGRVRNAKVNLTNVHIPVTVSDLRDGFQNKANGAPNVFKAVDFVDLHTLPFFDSGASTGDKAWPMVKGDIQWILDHAPGKKIYLSENGWPSHTEEGVKANSNAAVANVANEQKYYDLLDGHCSDFKAFPGGGIGWFAHLYSDAQDSAYGIYGTNGKLKFPFSPRTSC